MKVSDRELQWQQKRQKRVAEREGTPPTIVGFQDEEGDQEPRHEEKPLEAGHSGRPARKQGRQPTATKTLNDKGHFAPAASRSTALPTPRF